MEREEVDRWLEAYIAAWKAYDRDQIGELFSEDAIYRWHPWDDPVRGRDAIVAAWLDDRDDPGTYDARYEPVAVDGEVAVAVGHSAYTKADGSIDKIYDNCYVIRFDGEGRCREFTEWFMLRPSD